MEADSGSGSAVVYWCGLCECSCSDNIDCVISHVSDQLHRTNYMVTYLLTFTQRNFVADFFQAKYDFRQTSAVLCFWAPVGSLRGSCTMIILGSLEAHMTRSSKLALYKSCNNNNRKARSGLPISVNWTFFARCYDWCATSEYRFKIGDFIQRGPVDPKFHAAWEKRNLIAINHSNQQVWDV